MYAIFLAARDKRHAKINRTHEFYRECSHIRDLLIHAKRRATNGRGYRFRVRGGRVRLRRSLATPNGKTGTPLFQFASREWRHGACDGVLRDVSLDIGYKTTVFVWLTPYEQSKNLFLLLSKQCRGFVRTGSTGSCEPEDFQNLC